MLFRKMIRDMKSHKTQFLSIFLMAFLGVFIYSGIGGEWVGLNEIVDKYYNETNLADSWVYGKSFSKEDAIKVSNLEEIKDVERRLTIEGVGVFDNNPKLKLHFLEENNISKMKVLEGEEFNEDKDGIWLDSLFAKEKNLNVGDKIEIKINEENIEKDILGTIISPEYVYSSQGSDIISNHNNYGFGILSKKAFPKDIEIFYNELLLKTKDENCEGIEEEISKALDGHYSVYINKENNPSVQMFKNEIEQHKAMGTVFPIVFLAIAVLTILTTMTRIVNNQRTQIGTLKALGFKKKKILYHYISYGFWLSLIGALLGSIIGPITMPYLFYGSMKTTYTLPEWKPSLSFRFIIMGIIVVMLCTLFTYIACRKNLKDMPSESLRQKPPKLVKQSFIERTKLWKKAGFNIQWNFRDVFRSKARALMAIVGVLGCTALIICAFSMKDSLKDIIVWQYDEINKFETKLVLKENISEEDTNYISNELKGQGILEGAIEIENGNTKKTGEILVKDEATLISATDKERNSIDLPEDSLSISYKMAQLLNVKEGDKVKWHIYGDEGWITSKIGMIYRNPTSQGIILSKKLYEELGFKFIPTSYVTSQKVSDLPGGVESIWSREELTKSYEEMTEAMNIMVYVLIIAAVLLAVVVLYNLGVLSFNEMERELATLKVIGFKSKKIRRLLLTQNIWLTTIGIIIGIPIGKFLLGYIVSFMGDTLDWMTKLTPISNLYTIAITFSFSIIVNLLFSRKIKNIDMVSSLKGNE